MVPIKKPAKKPTKQALKSMLAILTPLIAPPAGSTCFISNTHAYLYIANIAPEAFAANKHKRLFAPSPPGPFKPY